MNRLAARTDRLLTATPTVARGIGFMLLACLAASMMNVLIRTLSQELHPFVLVLFRNGVTLVLFLPLLMRNGFGTLKTRRLPMHLFRGALNVISMFSLFMAISLLPLAKFQALGFSAPLFATVLAIFILGERVRIRRLSALALGFAGMLLIVRPGVAGIDSGAGLALLGAAGWGAVMMVIKSLSRTESSATTTLYGTLCVLPFAAMAAALVWQTPTWWQMPGLIGIGVLGTVFHFSLTQAFREAEATVLLPFDFTKLLWSAAFGYLIFAEIPDRWTWIGGTVIFLAATYIGIREHRLGREGRRERGKMS